MRKFKKMLACATLLALAAPAAAQTPAEAAAQPARWHLDGATSRCVLTRRLAGTPIPATFVLRTIPGSGRYDVILASTAFPEEIRRLRNLSRLTLVLGPDVASVEVPAGSIELPDSLGEGLSIGPLPAEFVPVFGRSATLAVADEGRQIARWTVPAAARAAEAVSYCEAEKLTEWGADPAGLAPGATPPRPAANAGSWVSPRQLGLHDALGSVAYTAVYRLGVGADGRVSDCTLLESAGNVDLSRGCRILSGVARYSPALDAGGNPVRSVAIHIVDVRTRTEIRIIEG